MGWVIFALLAVLMIICLVIGFNAIAALLGAILDACDPD